MKRKVFLFVVLTMQFFNPRLLISQNPQTNLEKYWVYRERLKNFIISDDCQGCGLPAVKRGGHQSSEDNQVTFADETTRLGLYIGFLACEYKLLKDAGDSYLTQTKKDLYYALQAFNRLDFTAEGWLRYSNANPNAQLGVGSANIPNTSFSQNDINGFFIRDDVPPDFPERKYNGKRVANMLSNGLVPLPDDNKPITIDAGFYPLSLKCTPYVNWPREESLDQVVELYAGLALVVKLVNSDGQDNYNGLSFHDPIANTSSFHYEAKKIVERIEIWMDRAGYTIFDPATGNCAIGTSCGSISTPYSQQCGPGNLGGSNLAGLDYGFYSASCQIMSEFTGIQGCSTLTPPTINDFAIWQNTLIVPVSQEDKVLKLAATGNSYGTSATANTLNAFVGSCVGLSPMHVQLLHQILYGGSTGVPNSIYECMLNSAPCRGTNMYNQNFEWSNSEGRVMGGPDADNTTPGVGFFADDETNGIDYMYYLTLYSVFNPNYYNGSFHSIDVKTHLCTYDLIKHDNIENYERNFYASHNITAGKNISDYIIQNNSPLAATDPEYCANVTFKAGNEIDLNPGFSVIPGAYFNGQIDATIGSNNCIDPPSIACSLCAPTGGENTNDPSDYGDYKVYPIDNNYMYVSTPHQLFKIANTGGSGENMFNIEKNGTLYQTFSGPTYMIGYQDFSGYTNTIGTNAPKITDVDYIVYNNSAYTFISFDDGSMVKLSGTGGTNDDMFCITKNHGTGSTNNVCQYGPFCADQNNCGYFLGTQQFNHGITQVEFLQDVGALMVFLDNGEVLRVGGPTSYPNDCNGCAVLSPGVGGGGANMFGIHELTCGTFAFESCHKSACGDLTCNSTDNTYYQGDMFFRSAVTCFYREPGSKVVVGLESGKIFKIPDVGTGDHCFYANETNDSPNHPFPNLDNNGNYGTEWCGESGSSANCGGGALIHTVPLPSGQYLLFFDNNQYMVAHNGLGSSGDNFINGYVDYQSSYPSNLSCYFNEGVYTYLGFEDGTIRKLNWGTEIGNTYFGSRVTDLKKINNYYFICLANGKIIKTNGSGSGLNIFGLNYTNPCFENMCGYYYYEGCQNFSGINANRQASTSNDPAQVKADPKGITTGINKSTINNSNLQIFPNPNNGTFTVEISESAPQLLEMFDLTGNLILSQTIIGKTTISANDLPEGIYNIKITKDGNIVNKRMIIAK
jgi:hypothetical protein